MGYVEDGRQEIGNRKQKSFFVIMYKKLPDNNTPDFLYS